MLRYLLIGLFVMLLFVGGCGTSAADEAEDSAEEVESVLTAETEEEITGWVESATMYSLYKIEADDETVTVWIDLIDDAVDKAEDYATGLAERIALLYDDGVGISVTAMQSIEDSNDVYAFGNAYITKSGKLSYDEY